jgi:4-hydroxy-3-methylbut-2-en-1-yl diphosphate synthase IspG/GcpE
MGMLLAEGIGDTIGYPLLLTVEEVFAPTKYFGQ